MPSSQPNVLLIMTDQQRFDTIAALGNRDIYTPNFDRLVQRGVTFTQGYSACPVCVAARYTIRTGCLPPTTRIFSNGRSNPAAGQAATLPERCGPYLAAAMRQAGYRAFGVGKFHTNPRNEDLGYDVQIHTEEMYGDSHRDTDGFASWIAKEHPALDFVECLMGERTEMYYMPQMSSQPAEFTVERFVADRVTEQLQVKDPRPYFGFVSFIGPHPPFAPPIPFNRLYNPDRLPNPIRGDRQTDHMDEQIPWMNYMIWAEDINDSHARVLKARYYGEITYIDECLGRILDAVEARPDADNTLICFVSDHGDGMGDHHAWQKESFFEQSCHVPFLLSWPARFPGGVRRDELVGLEDLFGIATTAAGQPQLRDGIDVLGVLSGQAKPRQYYFGYYGPPGDPLFKIMVRHGPWKYNYFANGGREQLFNLANDPNELQNLAASIEQGVQQLRRAAIAACRQPGAKDALDGDDFKSFPFAPRRLSRVYQFDASRGVRGFASKPKEAIDAYYARMAAKR